MLISLSRSEAARPEKSTERSHRCGCGGPITAGGECEACRQRRLGRPAVARPVPAPPPPVPLTPNVATPNVATPDVATPDAATPVPPAAPLLRARDFSHTRLHEADLMSEARPSGRVAVSPSPRRSLIDQVLRSPGRPLEPRDVSALQGRFGPEISRVRVHTDHRAAQSARAIDAAAYTVADHVVFGAGQYRPATHAGRRLLAHELAHVVARPAASATEPARDGLRLSRPSDPAEREAVSVSERVAGPADASLAGAVPAAPGSPAVTAARSPAVAAARSPAVAAAPRSPAGAPDAPLTVHRKIQVGSHPSDAAEVARLTATLISGPLRGLVGQVGAGVVREAIRELDADPDQLAFPDIDALATNIRQRVLVSHYMRTSQGSSPYMKAFSYPNRSGDHTVGIGPKVNDAAKGYWDSVQGDPAGVYWFDLKPTAKGHAYEALLALFHETSKPGERTLIHCDYLVSVIEFRAYAENLGRDRFNALVVSGALPMRLKWDGFTDLVSKPLPPAGGGPSAAAGRQPPLKVVPVAKEDELLVGDHVVFYNHETYDLLNQGPREVWRLENAIVIDKTGGHLRYQGHGYFAPVTKDVLLGKILYYYNLNVRAAERLVSQAKGTGKTAAAARDSLQKRHNVSESQPGHWVISGHSGLCAGRPVTRELKPLKEAEAPALKSPCDQQIWVRRPIETKP